MKAMMDSSDPRANGAKVTALLREEAGRRWADLYRTCDAGPSGQRTHTRVGRVVFLPYGPYEFRIIADDGDTAGYATRRPHDGPLEWTVWSDNEYDGIRLYGYASTLSLGVDALLNGDYAATGRHGGQRRSGGRWQRYVPEPFDHETDDVVARAADPRTTQRGVDADLTA